MGSNSIFNSYTTKEITDMIISWIKMYFQVQPQANGAVLGISGGKDSAVVAALLKEALGKEKVHGVMMPNGNQPDIKDSYDIINHLDICHKEINVGKIYESYIHELELASPKTFISPEGVPELERIHNAKINILPRIRMSLLYAIGSAKSLRIAGTGNLCEYIVGYFTKWGDGACDFDPILHLTVSQVKAVGHYLGLPAHIIDKTPSDGLSNLTDEQKLKVSYDNIEYYLYYKLASMMDKENKSSENPLELDIMQEFFNEFNNGQPLDPQIYWKIDKMVEYTKHKRRPVSAPRNVNLFDLYKIID